MTATGIIILGNSGTGKSFLGNIILGQEAFKHEMKMDACTKETEYRTSSIDGKNYAVYNIPGLIEADQDRIDHNIKEIDSAFIGHPNSVIIFLLGVGNGGRVTNEDIIAFNAINKAYQFDKNSIIFVLNQVDESVVNLYRSSGKEKLKGYLKFDVLHLCVVPKISGSSTNEKNTIQSELLSAIKNVHAKLYTKKQNIVLLLSELSTLKKQVADLEKKLDNATQQRELQETRRMFDAMHVRDSPIPIYAQSFAPVPCVRMPSNDFSDFDLSRFPTGSRPLKADGTPDLRYKINSIFK